jgi:hypothetical protein
MVATVAANITIEKINPTRMSLLAPPSCTDIKELSSNFLRISDCTTNMTAVEIKKGTTRHAKPKGVIIARLHKSFGNSQKRNKREKKSIRIMPAMRERWTVSRTVETTFFSMSWSCCRGALRAPRVLGTVDEILKGKLWQSWVELFSHPKQTLLRPIDIFFGITALRPDCAAVVASVAAASNAELTAVWAAWRPDVAAATAVATIGGTSSDEASGISNNARSRSYRNWVGSRLVKLNFDYEQLLVQTRKKHLRGR